MRLLADSPRERTMRSRNWDTAEADRAYMSHHHTVEVISDLAYEHGLFETVGLHAVSPFEYRNSFISMASRLEFSISTVVYPDSSTYTYIHLGGENLGPVLNAPGLIAHRLPNANIKRPEGRARRALEIILALQDIGVLPSPPTEEKKISKPSGIVAKKNEDGTFTLDYSGARSGKIESVTRILDYREFNKVRSDDKEQKPAQGDSRI